MYLLSLSFSLSFFIGRFLSLSLSLSLSVTVCPSVRLSVWGGDPRERTKGSLRLCLYVVCMSVCVYAFFPKFSRMAPKWSKNEPKWSQNGTKWTLGRPWGPRGVQGTNKGSKRPKKGPKRKPKWGQKWCVDQTALAGCHFLDQKWAKNGSQKREKKRGRKRTLRAPFLDKSMRKSMHKTMQEKWDNYGQSVTNTGLKWAKKQRKSVLFLEPAKPRF